MSRFVTARIEIPIEIKVDGTYIKHSDRTQVNFYHCDVLPPKQDHESMRFAEILENLFAGAEDPLIRVKPHPPSQPNSDGEESESLTPPDASPDEFITSEKNSVDDYDDQYSISTLMSVRSQPLTEAELEEYFVLKSEIGTAGPKAPSKNTSFKRYESRGPSSHSHNLSVRRRR